MKNFAKLFLILALAVTSAFGGDGHTGSGGFTCEEGHTGSGGIVCEGHTGSGGFAGDGHTGSGGITEGEKSDAEEGYFGDLVEFFYGLF